jgi:hypothetical protein
MNSRIFKLTIMIALSMQACGDEHQFLPQIEKASDPDPKIKFIHAASDTVGVNLFLANSKITGNLPSTITTFGSVNLGKVNPGTVTFQNAFPVTNYTSVKNPSGILSVVFPESYNATTTFPKKTLSSVDVSALAPLAYYTVAFVGVSPAYETVVYEDDLSDTPIDGKTYIRFANFIHNSPTNLTLRATPPATTDEPTPAAITLFLNVAYKGMTEFVALPRSGAYTNIQILNANTNGVIATLASANSALANNKVYTIFARGRIGATGTAAPGVTRIINR